MSEGDVDDDFDPEHRLRLAAKQIRLYREDVLDEASGDAETARQMEILTRAEYLVRGVYDQRRYHRLEVAEPATQPGGDSA